MDGNKFIVEYACHEEWMQIVCFLAEPPQKIINKPRDLIRFRALITHNIFPPNDIHDINRCFAKRPRLCFWQQILHEHSMESKDILCGKGSRVLRSFFDMR